MKNTINGFVLGVLITTLLISTAFGAQVKKTIEVVYNSVNLTVNGVKVNADNILYNGTTYVPIRAVAETLGKEVGWDQKTSTVSVNDKGWIAPVSKETKQVITKSKFEEKDFKFQDLLLEDSNMGMVGNKYGTLLDFEYIHNEQYNDYTKILWYEGINFEFLIYGDDENIDSLLYGYELTNNKYAGPRRIKVGDNVDDVLLNFPNDNSSISNYGTKRLYGTEYEHHGDIFYDNSKNIRSIKLVYYIDTSYGKELNIEITNDKVTKIEVASIP